MLQLGNINPKTFAYAYLEGLKHAVDGRSEKIIEMDANRSHQPKYIPDFIDTLDTTGAVFSSRFSEGGGTERYSIPRKVISKGGTLAANAILGLGSYVPDMTGGYEAFQREVLGDVFEKVPIEEWISVNRGPGHFYQTEMRTLVIWRGHNVGVVPIKWGSERSEDPKNLPLSTATAALRSLYLLRQKRDEFIAT